jgi:hypothetical protein
MKEQTLCHAHHGAAALRCKRADTQAKLVRRYELHEIAVTRLARVLRFNVVRTGA